ncbi:MAG: hypothetical protein NC120_03675 [Ruminococcus sp.]|nr:hypothetical protein [Ruminococcus sp.]
MTHIKMLLTLSMIMALNAVTLLPANAFAEVKFGLSCSRRVDLSALCRL